ncbi:helix-turn-helix transcriptional regulator [Sphingomonas sp. RHCKR7]|nr:helix-turn-helix transcriptional regulator [Sphingomonas folli]
MELLGERWALLIVRELMFGPRRFTELRGGLPGISANVLTQRLERLAATAVVQKVEMPGGVSGYALTDWGYEAEPAIMSLGRWAARSPDHDPALPLSAASMMMSLRTMADPARVPGPITIGFLFDRDSFVARLADGALAIARAPAFGDAVFDTDPRTMAAIVYGKLPVAAAEAAGSLRFGGDRAAAEAFIDLFHLPAKATRAAAAG